MSDATSHRILVIDDQESIHEDFQKIFRRVPLPDGRLLETTSSLFDEPGVPRESPVDLAIDSATQGEEGLRMIRRARDTGRPYAMAFVDLHMPPGLDGVETIGNIWKESPTLQVVVCSAHLDSWFSRIATRLGGTDRLFLLKKPFGTSEVRHLVEVLIERHVQAERMKSMVEWMQSMLAEQAEQIAQLRRQLEDAKQDDSTRPIRRNSRPLLKTLKKAVDMRPPSAAVLGVRRVRCSLEEILFDALADVRPRAEEKGVVIEHEFCNAPPKTILTDPVHLRQLLAGLIGSALRLTTSSSLCMLTRMKRDGEAEMMIHVNLLDSSTRITEKEIGRLLHPLSRSSQEGTADLSQARLELATWKQLARSLGGNLAIDRLAAGTQYRLSVAAGPIDSETFQPTVNGSAQTQPSKRSVLPTALPTSLDCHVLLVEDDSDHQPLVALILRKAGCQVTIAENGKVALELAQAASENGRQFDIVLMDMQMPVLDGLSATRLLRATGFAPPIIALTARAITTDRQKCLDAGCDAFLSKPFDRNELVRLLAGHLGQSPAMN